jgi:hypothetical protein
VVLLRGRHLASWLLALGERDGHNDLRGSGRLSVIPYIYGRIELYYAQACLAWAFPFFDLCEEMSIRSFYNSRSGSYNETRSPTGGPEVDETLYNI